ncbi:hypothetical protein CPB84DRAFT_1849117 [Gymnopilus junonius]|uniref:Uncharacterized protein n=1 Tax=Gymnopilus junonius TaxID=109634 RepID=A0A9P5NLB0_GYMJU|nr:hypothetical protein CPB84DRAFT_1849117 [Gymnopilus junonius]
MAGDKAKKYCKACLDAHVAEIQAQHDATLLAGMPVTIIHALALKDAQGMGGEHALAPYSQGASSSQTFLVTSLNALDALLSSYNAMQLHGTTSWVNSINNSESPSPAMMPLSLLVLPGTSSEAGPSLFYATRPGTPSSVAPGDSISNVSAPTMPPTIPPTTFVPNLSHCQSRCGLDTASPILPYFNWNAEKQKDFENQIDHLTAAAGLPLSWVDNPEFIALINKFIPTANPPSRKVLT